MSPLWVVFLYFVTYFSIRPSYLLFYNIDPFLFNTYPADSSIFFSTFLFIFFAYIPLCLGYLYSNYFKFKPDILKSNSLSEQILVLAAISFQVCVVISSFFIILNFGGLNKIISIQSSLVQFIPESSILIRLAWTFILTSFIPTSLMLVRYGYDIRFFAFLILNILICLIFGRRLSIASLLVPIAVYHYYYVKSFTVFRGLFFYLLGLIFLVSIVLIRISNSSQAGISLIEESAEFFIWDMIISLIYSFGVDTDFRMGADLLPKWIQLYFNIDSGFGDESIGESLVSIYYPFFPGGIPPGIFGLFFMQGGYFIMTVLSFLYGILIKIIHTHFTRRISNKLYFVILYSFTLISILHLTRVGDLWLTIISQSRILFVTIIIFTIINNVRIEKKYS
jgi:hypothetical protein